jgi:hypothetical protein
VLSVRLLCLSYDVLKIFALFVWPHFQGHVRTLDKNRDGLHYIVVNQGPGTRALVVQKRSVEGLKAISRYIIIHTYANLTLTSVSKLRSR